MEKVLFPVGGFLLETQAAEDKHSAWETASPAGRFNNSEETPRGHFDSIHPGEERNQNPDSFYFSHAPEEFK